VLTQPGLTEEGIVHAKERFEASWKAFYPTLRKSGLTAALATYHVKPNARFGWHYHCHLVAEFDGVLDTDSLYQLLNDRWKKCCSKHKSHVDYKELFMRLVTDPGPALVGMGEHTQLEFWDEPKDQVETCLHYILRDVLQGIETWIECMKSEDDCHAFCDFMGTAKRHRCYGTWRKTVKNDVVEERDKLEERSMDEAAVSRLNPQKGASPWSAVCTMDSCISTWRSGSGESKRLLQQLLGCTNRSVGVMSRLRKVVFALAA
jgi:hypothetical protein